MTLIVETGEGLPDAASYASLADAEAYHGARANTGWTGEPALREAALVRATDYLDGLYRRRWAGEPATALQALAWPRAYAPRPDGLSGYLAPDVVPRALVSACCEAALRELQAPGSLVPDVTPSERVVSETVGPLSTTYVNGPASDALPVLAVVERLVAPLLRAAAGGMVLRA